MLGGAPKGGSVLSCRRSEIAAIAVATLMFVGCGSKHAAGASPSSAAPSSPVASDEGSSTDWHLEEHALSIANGTSGSVVADCRGNNSLSWEVHTPAGATFQEPTRVQVFCAMYGERPANDDTFNGWGWSRINWPGSGDGCTFETRTAHGGQQCTDYFRAQRDTIPISAPWCRLTFEYDSPTTVQASVVTYCVTR